MRRRYQLNLYTESDLESEVADYIEKFPQGTKRSEEIRRLCLIGYQIIIRGKSEDEAILQSYDPGLQKVIANYVREERERSSSSSNLAELVSLLQNKGKTQEDLLLEALLSKSNSSESGISDLLSKLLLDKGVGTVKSEKEELSRQEEASSYLEPTPEAHRKEISSSGVQSHTEVKKSPSEASQKTKHDESNNPTVKEALSKRYVPGSETSIEVETADELEAESELLPDVNPAMPEYRNDSFLTEAEDIDIDEEDEDIEDPLSRLGF